MPLATTVSLIHHRTAMEGDQLARLTYAHILGDCIDEIATLTSIAHALPFEHVQFCIRAALHVPVSEALVSGPDRAIASRVDQMFARSPVMRHFAKYGWAGVEAMIQFAAVDAARTLHRRQSARSALARKFIAVFSRIRSAS